MDVQMDKHFRQREEWEQMPGSDGALAISEEQ